LALQNSFTAAKSSKFSTKPVLGYPPHLVLLHYLGKLKNQKFCILKHLKHISIVTFYHLSNTCLPNVMKINVKINTMQNTNILLFVRSLSLMYWRNAYLWYGPISDRSLLTLQLTSEESVSRHACWKFSALWQSERILQIHQELTKL